jgi:hypothetical protein
MKDIAFHFWDVWDDMAKIGFYLIRCEHIMLSALLTQKCAHKRGLLCACRFRKHDLNS